MLNNFWKDDDWLTEFACSSVVSRKYLSKILSLDFIRIFTFDRAKPWVRFSIDSMISWMVLFTATKSDWYGYLAKISSPISWIISTGRSNETWILLPKSGTWGTSTTVLSAFLYKSSSQAIKARVLFFNEIRKLYNGVSGDLMHIYAYGFEHGIKKRIEYKNSLVCSFANLHHTTNYVGNRYFFSDLLISNSV